MTKPTKRAQARQDASDILILATYREIQTSGNPLQDYELRILVNRYPTQYGVLRRFLPESCAFLAEVSGVRGEEES